MGRRQPLLLMSGGRYRISTESMNACVAVTTVAGNCIDAYIRARPASTWGKHLPMRTLLAAVAITALCAACARTAPQSAHATATADLGAHQAHEAYVTAINSNNLDTLLGML